MALNETPLRAMPFDLLVDGQALPAPLAQGLASLSVQQHLCSPSACELVLLGVGDSAALDCLRPGSQLRISPRRGGGVLFDGAISAVEAGYGAERMTRVAVRAFDALGRLRKRQTPRAFVGLDAAALARELVGGLGLTVNCDEPGPAWPRCLQTGSDFDLLADAAERCGLYFHVDDGVLWLQTLRGRGDPVLLTLHDNLHEVRVELNVHAATPHIELAGWNPWRGSEHRGRADTARRMPGAPAGLAGLAGAAGAAGAAGLAGRAGMPGGTDPAWLPGWCLQGDEQALALAQAELDRREAHTLALWGTAAGDARLRPGVRVRIAGIAADLCGEHLLASVRHTLDARRGYVCELSSALPAPRRREAGTLLALGEVTRIDDPDRLGRVQVALPAHGHVESDWLQLVGAGAGKGKGLVAQPDVGDRVLLLVDRADPAQAVVLGALWGEAGLPEGQGGLGAGASFCFVTPGGHRLRLDDGDRTLRLHARDGSTLELGPERVCLHAQAPMTIEAPGQTLTIRANFIDFQRG